MGRFDGVVVVADKTKSVDVGTASALVNAIDGASGDLPRALIVYGSRSAPLVDPWSEAPLMEAYLESPILGTRPEPVLGLKEAMEVSLDFGLGRPLVALIWSASVRPRIKLEPLISSMEGAGVRVELVILRPSPPKWLRLSGVDPQRPYYVRSNTNLARLASRLVEGRGA